MPSAAARSAVITGSKPITFMRRPRARSATMRPMLPRPIDAERLAGELAALELLLLPFAGLERAARLRDHPRERHEQARSRARRSSPRCRWACSSRPRRAWRRRRTSTLSTPMPARPMTLSRSASARTLAVTLEPERITSASRAADRGGELGLAEAGLVVDLEALALAEDGEALLAQGVGDEDAVHEDSCLGGGGDGRDPAGGRRTITPGDGRSSLGVLGRSLGARRGVAAPW